MVWVLFTVGFFTFYLVEQYLHWQPNAPVIPIVVMGLAAYVLVGGSGTRALQIG